MRFFDFLLEKRAIVLILGAVVVLLGALAWVRLPIDAFPDVTNTQVTILTEACEEAAKVDADRARRALEQAESALASLAQDDVGFAEQERRSLRARARLDAAARR